MKFPWAAWEFAPGVVIPLAASALLYSIGSGRQFGITRLQRICFWTGWLTLALALMSPLHALGETLFSAHMIQHEFLMLIAAPLLVLSRPLVTLLWALPVRSRRSLGRWSKITPVQSVWLLLTAPPIAWWLHALAIWLWHAPPFFEATLHSQLAHGAQHLSFFFSALLFWWALFYAHGRKHFGTAILFVFLTALHTGILGALLTFSPRLWYPSYNATAPAWGMSGIEDQQIGGLIMWVPASLIYLAAALLLFAEWMKESDTLLERARRAS